MTKPNPENCKKKAAEDKRRCIVLSCVVQELPEMWNNTKKAAIAMKQHVAPLQANEVANIRKRTAAFDVRQHEFREEFRKMAPLLYSCPNAYDLIDEVNCYSSSSAECPLILLATNV